MRLYTTLMNRPTAYRDDAETLARSSVRSVNRKYKTKLKVVSVVRDVDLACGDEMYSVLVSSRDMLSFDVCSRTLLRPVDPIEAAVYDKTIADNRALKQGE